jgi:hypothetical protein
VAFKCYLVTDAQPGDTGADLDDGACAFVAQDDREVEVEGLGGGGPFIQFTVRAAEGRGTYFDDD